MDDRAAQAAAGRTTERLVLRALRPDDAGPLFAYRAQPNVARYQSWEPASLDEVRAFIADAAAAVPFAPGSWYQLGIELRTTGVLIGDCGIHVLAADPEQVEIGITVAPAFQGRGYAGETLRAMLDHVFGTLRKHRVFASVDPRNIRSVALLQRNGFRQEAHHVESIRFKDAWADDVVFALLEREWESRST